MTEKDLITTNSNTPEDSNAISEFYLNYLNKSNKRYKINFILQTLVHVDEVTEDTFDEDTEDTYDNQLFVDNFNNSQFRIMYDNDDKADPTLEDEFEEVSPATPLVDTIWDTPYLFLKTLYNQNIDFDVEDFTSFFLLEFVGGFVDNELDLEFETEDLPQTKQFLHLSKTTKRSKKKKYYNKKYSNKIINSNIFNLFNIKTCKEFFINLTVYKKFINNKLNPALDTGDFFELDFEYEETLLINNNLICLELLIHDYKIINYFNIKYRFLIDTVANKTLLDAQKTLLTVQPINSNKTNSRRRIELNDSQIKFFTQQVVRLRRKLILLRRYLKTLDKKSD